MAVKKTPADLLAEKLAKELAREYDQQQSVTREGTQVILPEGMELKTAIAMLTKLDKEKEMETSKEVLVYGHVHDSLVAFKRATEALFGRVVGETVFGFFSFTPGAMTATVGFGQTESVPSGEVTIPGLGISIYLSTYTEEEEPMESSVRAVFRYKRKFQTLVDQIERDWKAWIAERSIFKGQAIDSKFNFLDLRSAAVATQRLVYTFQEESDLGASIITPIMRPQEVVAAGLTQRRTVILTGKYGTGKTLTALLIAQKAIENGWTFMNVLPGQGIEAALNFAKRFMPTVLFFEDIDAEVGGQQRDSRVNGILNTMDGLLSKTDPVIVVLTTNHVGRINRALLRPGRIDAVIELGHVDAYSVVQLMEAYIGERLVGELNGQALMEIGGDMTPAFYVEAAKRAILYSLYDGDRNGISQEHIEATLRGLLPQWELMSDTGQADSPTLDSIMSGYIETTREGLVRADQLVQSAFVRKNGGR